MHRVSGDQVICIATYPTATKVTKVSCVTKHETVECANPTYAIYRREEVKPLLDVTLAPGDYYIACTSDNAQDVTAIDVEFVAEPLTTFGMSQLLFGLYRSLGLYPGNELRLPAAAPQPALPHFLRTVHTEYGQVLAAKEKEHAETLDALKMSHDEEIASLKMSHEEEVVSIKTTHSEEIEALKTVHDHDIASIKASYDHEVDALKTTHEEEVASIRTSDPQVYREEIARLNKVIADQKKEFEDTITQAVAAALANKPDLKYKERFNALNIELEEAIERIHKLQTHIQDQEQERLHIEESYKAKLDAVNKSRQEDIRLFNEKLAKTEAAGHKLQVLFDEYATKLKEAEDYIERYCTDDS